MTLLCHNLDFSIIIWIFFFLNRDSQFSATSDIYYIRYCIEVVTGLTFIRLLNRKVELNWRYTLTIITTNDT